MCDADPLCMLSWDHPLSRGDVWRRVLIQCDRLRHFASGQAKEAALATDATLELLRQHGAVYGRAVELEQQCREAKQDAASARQEADWFKKILEGVAGLNPSAPLCRAALDLQKAGFNSSAAWKSPKGGVQSSAALLLSGVKEDAMEGSKERSASSEANRRTIMRRVRRRQCRQRYVEAQAAAQESPVPAAVVENGALDARASAAAEAEPKLRRPSLTPRGTPAAPAREQLGEVGNTPTDLADTVSNTCAFDETEMGVEGALATSDVVTPRRVGSTHIRSPVRSPPHGTPAKPSREWFGAGVDTDGRHGPCARQSQAAMNTGLPLPVGAVEVPEHMATERTSGRAVVPDTRVDSLRHGCRPPNRFR